MTDRQRKYIERRLKKSYSRWESDYDSTNGLFNKLLKTTDGPSTYADFIEEHNKQSSADEVWEALNALLDELWMSDGETDWLSKYREFYKNYECKIADLYKRLMEFAGVGYNW